MSSDDNKGRSKRVEIIKNCWNRSVKAWGAGFLFEKRAQGLGLLLRSEQVLGLFIPAAIGIVVLWKGGEWLTIGWIGTLIAIVLILKALFSLYTIAGNWRDGHEMAQDLSARNYRLSDEFKNLADMPPEDIDSLRNRYEDLMDTWHELRELNQGQEIREREKRMAHRAALRNFERECIHCENIPRTLEPSDCPVCGQFYSWKIANGVLP